MGHKNEAALAQIIAESGLRQPRSRPPWPELPHPTHTPETRHVHRPERPGAPTRRVVGRYERGRRRALAKRMLLEEGVNPMHVLDLCREAMDIVGKRFEEGEYFLPELVLAGEMLDNVGAIAAADPSRGEGGGAAAGQGADRHRARRPARHRQEHRHLHARHQRLRGEGHRRGRAGADLHRRDQGLPARRGGPVGLPHAGLRLDEGNHRRLRRRRPAQRLQDHDRRRPDRRDRARLHRGRCLRRQRRRSRGPVPQLDGVAA